MFYIYEKSSTFIIGMPDSKGVARPDHRQYYKTMAAAKAGLTRIKKAENLLPTDPNYAEFRYAICQADYFHKLVEKKVKKTSLMDPTKEFMEPVNTPGYMSPSTERYWSM